MRRAFVYLLALVVFLLQTTVVPTIQFGGVHPNLTILFLVTILLLNDGSDGIRFALVSGLLQDVFLAKALGLNTLIYLMIALLIHRFKEVFFSETRTSVMIAAALAGFFYHAVFYMMSVLVMEGARTFTYAVFLAVTETLYDIVLIMLLYGVVFRSLKGYHLN